MLVDDDCLVFPNNELFRILPIPPVLCRFVSLLLLLLLANAAAANNELRLS
jgi:hypothetical protein